jgi:hypothetical protein
MKSKGEWHNKPSARYCDSMKKRPMTDDQGKAIVDRFNTNAYNHAMRQRMFAEMRRGYVRELLAEAKATAFNDVFRKSGVDFKCIICGAPMAVQRSTKKTCSARCRTQLSRLARAVRAKQEEREDNQRLCRIQRDDRRGDGDKRFVMVPWDRPIGHS